VLTVLLSCPTAAAAHGASLFGGSLTWSIHPEFATGKRLVEFTLDTSFEMTLTNSDCVYKVGQNINCSVTGRLCVDQYERIADDLYSVGHDYINEAKCVGIDNKFTVHSTQHINGANIVFGRLHYTVAVVPRAFAVIAFLSTGRNILDAEAAAAGKIISSGTLLPQCSTNMSAPAMLPCSVNSHHRQYNASKPIEYGLFKTPDQPRAKVLSYFGNVPNSWAATAEGLGLYEQFPSLETLVPLCATEPSDSQFKCDAKSEDLRNYFSPRPVVPGVVEVAVTPFTQVGITPQNPSGSLARKTYADVQTESEPFRYWYFPGHGSTYTAPHPPLYLKAYDLDGHKMTQFTPLSVNAFPEASNRRLECFNGSMSGAYYLSDNSFHWPHPDANSYEQCAKFFDGDGSSGNIFKFDFDFGSHASTAAHAAATSPIYGINNSLLSKRCAGARSAFSVPLPTSPYVCRSPAGVATAALTGSLVFSQHVVNTADFPFYDVDNLPADTPHVSTSATWRSKNLEVTDDDAAVSNGQERSPKGAMVSSVLSAYACYAGSENQPPRFVRELDSVPQQGKLCQKSSFYFIHYDNASCLH